MMIRRCLAALAVGGTLAAGLLIGTGNASAQAVLKPLTAADVAKVCTNPNAADRAREALGCGGVVTVPTPVVISAEVTVQPNMSQEVILTCPDGLNLVSGSITYSPALPGNVEPVGRTELTNDAGELTGYRVILDAAGMTEAFTTTASVTCV